MPPIAGLPAHLGDLVHINCDEKRATAERGCSMSRLATGMTGSNHDNIIIKSHKDCYILTSH